MSASKIAIPLFGKMATRTFHSRHFREALQCAGLDALYFVGPHYLEGGGLDRSRYLPLRADQYDRMFRESRLLRLCAELRRFAVRTETTDLRFRESIEALLFREGSVSLAWLYAACTDLLRRVPRIGDLAAWCESTFFPTHVHDDLLRANAIEIVLTPGTGSFGFWNEGMLAREARRLGLPVVAAITNYDNVVNMGYRGFLPDRLAVWSQLMADEAIRYQKIPATRIEITGPVQYDRYFRPIVVSREQFLSSKGLDPKRQTIFFAGGVNITRYFELFQMLSEAGMFARCNFVVRPYPHVKLLSSPGWRVLESLLSRAEGVCISNPLSSSSDRLIEADSRRDLRAEEDLDELHCLMRYSDVLINVFSTVSLEAAICDLPVIHLGYDSYTFGHMYNTTTAFQRRQTHNRRPLRLAAAKIARDESELRQQIERYLNDRTIDAPARRAYAMSECHACDGRATERLAAVLRDEANARQ